MIFVPTDATHVMILFSALKADVGDLQSAFVVGKRINITALNGIVVVRLLVNFASHFAPNFGLIVEAVRLR